MNSSEENHTIFSYYHVPYLVTNNLGTVIGVLGNILIMGSIFCSKELKIVMSIIIFNLSLADFIVAIAVSTFASIGVLVGKKFYDLVPWLCDTVSSICFIACFASLTNMALLAFSRWVFVCKKNWYSTIFTVKKTIIYCLFTWLLGVLLNFRNLITVDGHHFDTKILTCIFNFQLSRKYTLIAAFLFMIVPGLCLMFFYLNIFITSSLARTKIKRDHIENRKISVGLFASMTLFLIAVFPFALVLLIDSDYSLSPNIYMYTWLLSRLNSSLNPILYGSTNSLFKKGYKIFFETIYAKFAYKHVSQTIIVY